MNSLSRFYSALLHFYPRDFREEYGAEMQAVFEEAVRDAAQAGDLALMWLLLREVRDLPREALREHRRERSKRAMETQPAHPRTVEPVSRRGMLAAPAVFLIPSAVSVLPNLLVFILPDFLNYSSPTVIVFRSVLLLVSFVTLPILMIAGLVKGLPRWALPLAGLVVALAWYVLLSLMGKMWWSGWLPAHRVGDEEARLFWVFINAGFTWLNYLLAAILVTAVAAAVPPLRRHFWKWGRDWTQLSFLLYGVVLPSVWLAFEEYQYDEPFQALSALFLAVGAWVYLRACSPRGRLLALMAGVAGAMSVVAIGQWLIVPMQDWPVWFGWHPPEIERWVVSLSTLFEMGWMLIALAAPSLVRLIPPKKERPSGEGAVWLST